MHRVVRTAEFVGLVEAVIVSVADPLLEDAAAVPTLELTGLALRRRDYSMYTRHRLLVVSSGWLDIAEWLACWTQAQKGPGSNRSRDDSLRQTVHTRCASVHQAAKKVAALLRVAGVTAGLAESNGSLPPGL